MVAPYNQRREGIFAVKPHSGTNPIENGSNGAHDSDTLGGELALDLKGRKHVNQDDDVDAVYLLRVHASSIVGTLPKPGQASAHMLRQFLDNRLPRSLVTDEYGQITPISRISDDRLPALQSRMWQNVLEGNANELPCAVGPQDRVTLKACGLLLQHEAETEGFLTQNTHRIDQAPLLASHAAFIARLLDSKPYLNVTSFDTFYSNNCDSESPLRLA